METSTLRSVSLFEVKTFEVKTSLGAPHTFYSRAVSKKQSNVCHLSILNFHCTLCCDLTDLSAELQE
jgi:hypothetical protein